MIEDQLERIAEALETAQRPYLSFQIAIDDIGVGDNHLCVVFENHGNMAARLRSVSLFVTVHGAFESSCFHDRVVPMPFPRDTLLHRGRPLNVIDPKHTFSLSAHDLEQLHLHGKHLYVGGTLRFANFLPRDPEDHFRFCRAFSWDGNDFKCETHGIPADATYR